MKMSVKLTFFEPLLGTCPGSKEIVAEFVAGKLLNTLTPKQQRALFATADERKVLVAKIAETGSLDVTKIPDVPDEIVDKFEQELAAINAEGDLEKASTVFPRENGQPFIWDYQVKGFCKTACEAMQQMDTHTKEQLKKARLTPYLYKKTIDQLIFPSPRNIMVELPAGVTKLEFLERPLRAQTMRGERICLARSEAIPVGATVTFDIEVLNASLEQYVREWLDYGAYHGFLQWRSGGFGRFHWEETAADR
jgi:hypothetical protein